MPFRKRTTVERPKFRYKRIRVGTENQRRMMDWLRKKLKEPGFVGSLKSIKGTSYMGLVEFEGTPVLLKRVGSGEDHGRNYKKIRAAVLAVQKSVHKSRGTKNKRRYRIVTPRVYGRIGTFLVMEYMESGTLFDRGNLRQMKINPTNKAIKSQIRVFNQMAADFHNLEKQGKIPRVPQLRDVMVLGNTNPKKPWSGEWVFSLPYDFV